MTLCDPARCLAISVVSWGTILNPIVRSIYLHDVQSRSETALFPL